MLIMLTFVTLRFYVVLRIKKKMAPDDWAVVASLFGSVFYYVVVCLNILRSRWGTHLYNLSILHLKSDELAKTSFLTGGPSQLVWPCIKTIFFLMYLKLFYPLAWLRSCVYAGLTLIWAWYISMFVAQTVLTTPLPGQTWSEAFAGPRYLQIFKLAIPTASFSLVSDAYIWILPLIAISHLQLSFAKKIGVCAMFSAGLVCCIASSLSVYYQYRITKDQSDYTYHVAYVYLIYTLEMCIGISTSCMPHIAQLYRNKRGQRASSATRSVRLPWISPHQSHNQSYTLSKVSTLPGYATKSPYTNITDDPMVRPELYEMDRIVNEYGSHRDPNSGVSFPRDRVHRSVVISQSSVKIPQKKNISEWRK
ncbi:unnamed protein product [Periconia digitata]|uniref:Rhodopsin domain-containing protein n=1 Tax=Periconia digitata TaxID=1303443 RepID=A0A9W4XET8_9PLEO|nr:unnamed protein product [Periconia digitata]